MGCLCINSSVVTASEREGGDGGRAVWRRGEGLCDDEQPHRQQHLRSVALRLSAVTGNRPGLRQLHFINGPPLSAQACCPAILPNARPEFGDLLRGKSSRLTNYFGEVVDDRVRCAF